LSQFTARRELGRCRKAAFAAQFDPEMVKEA
jgi:hypothetical protein